MEIQTQKEKVLLIAVDTGDYDADVSMAELCELAETAGGEVVGEVIQKLPTINNKTYIGKGKIQEVKELTEKTGADMLIFDDELTGAQIKNIEEETGADVIDRTMLILDIFAQRARSSEGRLQVELAQQKYLLPRLIGMGKQLSRQQGGIGSRGPGETKLESDRRHIRRRIEALQDALEKMESRREQTRRRRSKNGIKTVAIVGYTNAGKSTLLNYLTDADVLAQDMLFATLDPTARALTLKNNKTVLLVDTVGFLQRLPMELIKAFNSTLKEAAEADLILLLADISDPECKNKIGVAKELLDELASGDTPILTVYNKIDRLENTLLADGKNESVVYISAKTGEGIDSLLDKISGVLFSEFEDGMLLIPYSRGDAFDYIMKNYLVKEYSYDGDGIRVSAELPTKEKSFWSEFAAEE